MKSISNVIKEEISNISSKQKLCCGFSTLYGMMLCSNKLENGKVTFSTNVENVTSFQKLCEFINQKKKINYSIEKRQVSVTTDVVKYFTIAEIE